MTSAISSGVPGRDGSCDLSVVIPSFNSSAFIEAALVSVERAAAGFAYEIIVIDDASADLPELKRLLYGHPGVRLITKSKRSNAADSRNLGLESARGEYIFFLDSDDRFGEDHIRKRLSLHRERGCGVLFGAFALEREGQVTVSPLPEYLGEDMRDYLFIKGGDFRSSTISLWREAYRGNTFDSQLAKHQDWAFAIRCHDGLESISLDAHPSVLIDNSSRSNRMSNTLNRAASQVFLSRYLSGAGHVTSFAAKHVGIAILSRDGEGLCFLRGLLIQSWRQTPLRRRMRNALLILLTLPRPSTSYAGLFGFLIGFRRGVLRHLASRSSAKSKEGVFLP